MEQTVPDGQAGIVLTDPTGVIRDSRRGVVSPKRLLPRW